LVFEYDKLAIYFLLQKGVPSVVLINGRNTFPLTYLYFLIKIFLYHSLCRLSVDVIAGVLIGIFHMILPPCPIP
jgi:hypothetical protein